LVEANNQLFPSVEIVWTKPERLTSRRADAGLIHFKNEGIDLRVTPDHRMLTYGTTQQMQDREAKGFAKPRGWFNGALRSQVTGRLMSASYDSPSLYKLTAILTANAFVCIF